jgi:hypothetical protein
MDVRGFGPDAFLLYVEAAEPFGYFYFKGWRQTHLQAV